MAALERAEDFLRGVEASFKANALAACALCCYATVFWAQIAVLEKLGVQRKEWRHDELRAWFGLEAIKKRRLFPTAYADYLQDAYRLRGKAHYSEEALNVKRVERLLRHTSEFVKFVKEAIAR